MSCVTLGTRHEGEGDAVSVVSLSFYLPPPTASPASTLSLSSPGSGSSAAANARRKRAEEDAGGERVEQRQHPDLPEPGADHRADGAERAADRLAGRAHASPLKR